VYSYVSLFFNTFLTKIKHTQKKGRCGQRKSGAIAVWIIFLSHFPEQNDLPPKSAAGGQMVGSFWVSLRFFVENSPILWVKQVLEEMLAVREKAVLLSG
jgi:hypothetical protein